MPGIWRPWPLCLVIATLPFAVVAADGQASPSAAPSTAAQAENRQQTTASESGSETGDSSGDGKRSESAAADQTSTEADTGPAPFALLDARVPPGETRQLSWVSSESFSGVTVPTPVLVAHGAQPGPTLCLTAAVHGDELNGIEMVRRVLYGLDAEKLSGTVVGVPIVNFFGFRRSTRYLPDRRDLNRYFPGDPDGSTASRIAHNFFQSIVRHCDALVDLHTGSFHRTNLPQLRADLDNPEVVELSRGFGAIAVLQSEGPEGTLRRAATNAGIPAITVEAGEPMRFQPEAVAQGVKGIHSLLDHIDMVDKDRTWGEPQPIYYESDWLRADSGGILFNRVEVGETVDKSQVLGTVTDPVTNTRTKITAPRDGRVLGMALNQAVIPGFAVYRLGFERSREEISQKAEATETADGSTHNKSASKKPTAPQSQSPAQQTPEAPPEPPPEQRPD